VFMAILPAACCWCMPAANSPVTRLAAAAVSRVCPSESLKPRLVIPSGSEVTVEMITHHAGKWPMPTHLPLVCPIHVWQSGVGHLLFWQKLSYISRDRWSSAHACAQQPSTPALHPHTHTNTHTHRCCHPPPSPGDDPDKMIRGDPGVEDIYKWGAAMNIPTRGATGQGEEEHMPGSRCSINTCRPECRIAQHSSCMTCC
jgi:hypothetical protein